MGEPEARGFVDTHLAGKKVVVFSKRYCHDSRRCHNLLWAHVPDDIAEADIDWIEIQDRQDYKYIQDYLKTLTGSSSVPRVFVNGKPIGGCEDAERLSKSGKLSDILRVVSV